jgi:hypothetical protein
MTRRPAITLIETLMAIFVMAIGLLALLTLFPLGAIQMAQALKDQRTAEASNIATAQFNAFGIANDPSLIPPWGGPGTTNTLFENPWPPPPPGQPATPPFSLPPRASGDSPTYPVYVDPIGVQAGMGPSVGAVPLGIPRVTVTMVPPAQGVNWQQRWFTLQDDITFLDNGTPDTTNGGTTVNGPIQREGRYTWAYMLRRVRAGTPLPVQLDLTVVVYAARSPGMGATAPLGEKSYTANFVSSNLIDISWNPATDEKPALRRGSWVLDSRMIPVPQGWFYRVTNVTDVDPSTVEIEVQTPLGGPLRAYGGPGTIVVMENVSEVFEKGTNY